MKTIAEVENTLKTLKPLLARQYFVEKIGYFGSYASNEQDVGSDIDILVSFKNRWDGNFLTCKTCWKKN